MKWSKRGFCKSRWVLLGFGLSESASRSEVLISHLKNVFHYTISSTVLGLLLANMIVNHDNFPIEMRSFFVLEFIAGLPMCGILFCTAPFKFEIHKLMENIDELCDERKSEFTSKIYSRTEKVVYFLHKVILPLDSTFFLFSYLSISCSFAIYHTIFSDEELDYENLFHMMYLLYVCNCKYLFL